MNRFVNFAAILLVSIVFCGHEVLAQSTNQDFPTAVTTNEVSGVIKARDIGDSRLTSYFYALEGSQGDLFVNIVTKNFTGDIDIWAAAGLKPLTKIVVYADLAESETGRVIYLRKPEKMILRVQGRTPGDEPALFRVKFAGSFVASAETTAPDEPALPKVVPGNESGIRVNSVGTIIEVIPKPKPTPKETVAKAVEPERDVPEKTEPDAKAAETEKVPEPTTPTEEKKLEVVISDSLPKTETIAPPEKPAKPSRVRTRRARSAAAAKEKPKETVAASPESNPPKPVKEKPVDPLASINLVIEFKDGKTITRPMSEVFKFSVDKGILTVISKDGSIGRYSILDVAKVTIQ